MTATTIYWREPGVDEATIKIVDPALLRQPWLREMRFCGTLARFRLLYPGLRVAAASVRRLGTRSPIRIWYLRPTDVPTVTSSRLEAIDPLSIAPNGRSTPFFLRICEAKRRHSHD